MVDLMNATSQYSDRQVLERCKSQTLEQMAGCMGLTPLGNTPCHGTGLEALRFGSYLKKEKNTHTYYHLPLLFITFISMNATLFGVQK